MIDRAWLVAFASAATADPERAAIGRVIIAADRAGQDDASGVGEHVAFVNALIEGLGLKRPVGTPRKARFDANLAKFRRGHGRSLSHGAIAKALAENDVISQTTIRKRLRAIDAERARIADLLNSPIADHGRSLLRAAIEWRDALAEEASARAAANPPSLQAK